MKQRYNDHMRGIQPSSAFLESLEMEMNQALRRPKCSKSRTLAKYIPLIGGMCVACIALAMIFAPEHPDTVVLSALPDSVFAQGQTNEPQALSVVRSGEGKAEALLPLEMIDAELWEHPYSEDYDDGAFLVGTYGRSALHVYDWNDTDAFDVIETLQMGDACWMVNENLLSSLPMEGFKRVYWFDDETNEMKVGSVPEVEVREVEIVTDELEIKEALSVEIESLQIPGKVRGDGVVLRAGRSDSAPICKELTEGQYVYLMYRYGNWIWASTAPFCLDDTPSEPPSTGWIYVDEVWGMNWLTPINHVELLADAVNIRTGPDGEIIMTVNRSDCLEVGYLNYLGVTVPGKDSDWHYVSVLDETSKSERIEGYMSAAYVQLHTFRLGEQLEMDGVVSATLSYAETASYAAYSQTITGDQLTAWLARLRNAECVSTFETVCGEGTATVKLIYEDGNFCEIAMSADDCTNVSYNGVLYDYRTQNERIEDFWNNNSVSALDILPTYFNNLTERFKEPSSSRRLNVDVESLRQRISTKVEAFTLE